MTDQQQDQPTADMSKAGKADDEPRDFSAFLLDLNRGRTHRELSHGLRDVVAAVLELGKKGKVTFTVDVSPDKDSDDKVRITDVVKVEAPQPTRKPTAFYATDSNDLVRHNPREDPSLPGMPLPRDGR